MSLGSLDHIRVVPDHRIRGMVTYHLEEVLLATLVGVVCGADDWEGGRTPHVDAMGQINPNGRSTCREADPAGLMWTR